MKTANLEKRPVEFKFAGFDFPKYVWDLPRWDFAKRVERMRRRFTGPYYHAPLPVQPGDHGTFFYLDSDGMPSLRWKWCDDVCSGIRHTGWFSDEYGDAEKIRGFVMRLPHGRGFLAGWSMGEGMASEVDCYIYDDEETAAYSADSIAENVAEKEREYQACQQEERSNNHETQRYAHGIS